jgi:holliday junction DNA helicase RuvA
MIGSVSGSIKLKTDKYLIVEAGGIGYKISVSPDTLSRAGKAGDRISLWTHIYVREDALELYGFPERPELEFFEMLLGVSGIGPRSALSVLSVASPGVLRKAIGAGDTAYLTKVSGIGRKTAEKIMLELRDKIGAAEGGAESLQGELDALEALRSLGYRESEAREALKKVGGETDTGRKIKEALKVLGGK